MAKRIMQSGWPAVSGEIDIEFGAATVAKDCKAVWTKDGKRIEVTLNRDVFIVSQTKEVDPLYAERKSSNGK